MKYLLAALLAVLPTLYLGCSKSPQSEEDPRFKDKRVVLQVGDNKLTLGEVNKRFETIKFKTPLNEYAQKKRYVEQTIQRWLLIEGAKEAGLTAEVDSTDIIKLRLQILFKQKITSKVAATDSDIENFFQKYGGENEFGQIFLDDSLRADSIYQVLKAGGDFEQLARNFSKDPNAASNGGIVNYIGYSKPDPLQDIVFGLKIGEISPPVRGGNYWVILKLFDRIKNTKEDLEKNKLNYSALTNSYLQSKAAEKFWDDLHSQFHYQMVTSTVQMMLQKADSAVAAARLASANLDSVGFDPANFSPAELGMPMAKYDGGAYTVSDFLHSTPGQMPGQLIALLYNSAALEEYLDGVTKNPILSILAEREKVDQTQEFKDALEGMKGDILLKKMPGQINKTLVDLTEADIKKYYHDHPDEFYWKPTLQASAIAVKTKEEAIDLLARAKNGAQFSLLAKKYSLDRASAYNGGDLGFFTEARYTPIFQAGINLKKGDLGGPVEYNYNWWIFKVTGGINPSLKEYNLVRSDIISKLDYDRRMKAYSDYMDNMQQKTHSIMDLDLIKNNLFLGPLTQSERDST